MRCGWRLSGRPGWCPYVSCVYRGGGWWRYIRGRTAAAMYVGAPFMTPVPRPDRHMVGGVDAIIRSEAARMGRMFVAELLCVFDGFVAPQWGAGVTSGAPTFGGWFCDGGWRCSERFENRPYVCGWFCDGGWRRIRGCTVAAMCVGAPFREPVPRPGRHRVCGGGRCPFRVAGMGGKGVRLWRVCCAQWGAGVTSGAPTFDGWICGGWRCSGRFVCALCGGSDELDAAFEELVECFAFE